MANTVATQPLGAISATSNATLRKLAIRKLNVRGVSSKGRRR